MPAGAAMTTQATADLVAEVQALIRERERDGVLGLAELIGPAEWADLVPELAPIEAARILRTLSAPEASQLLGEMDPDDAADVVEALPDDAVAEILVRMKPEDAAEIRELSGYDPDTAAGIMTPEYVAVSKDATSAQAIAAIRRLVDEAETVNYVYVVDEERHLLGVLSLYRLLLSPGRTPVIDLMAPSTVRVKASADQETAARILTDRNLLAIPVVDDDDHP